MTDRPNHISLPPTPVLKSAMRQPQTPSGTSSPRSTPSGFLLSPTGTPNLSVPLFQTLTGSSYTSNAASVSTVGVGGYHHKVSFDTFENPAAQMFSYTIPVRSEGWERSKNTRVFLVAASPDESGIQALDWAMESLVQDGDEIIVFRGFDAEELGTSLHLPVLAIDAKASQPLADKDHDCVREEARELLRQVQRQNTEYEPDRKVITCCMLFCYTHMLITSSALDHHRVYCWKSLRDY